MSAPQVIGVVGAGTMGSGIAQLAAQSGARVLLFDAAEGAAAAGLERARAGVVKLVEKGALAEDASVVCTRLEVAGALEELAGCGLIIEAAPERLEVKHELFATLSAVAPGAVLASNTSSIPITAIARSAADPSRVVGLHFFNPAPLMQLVELIAGLQSSDEALSTVRASWSTAATARSASRRCGCCRRRSPMSRPSMRSSAPPASGWGRSSCRTSWGSTWASRSRSRSTS
jgi:3-hydroxybutyryl-CoA dehydrogenase